jgi:hypothetical protein
LENKQSESESESEIEIESDSESESTTTAPPPQTYIIQQAAKSLGYGIDSGLAEKAASSGTLPTNWLDGANSFAAFVDETLRTKYPGKGKGELNLLFANAFGWIDLKESYPAWREGRERKAAAAERKKAEADARANRPTECPKCGRPLDGMDCRECRGEVEFDVSTLTYKLTRWPADFDPDKGFDLAGRFQQMRAAKTDGTREGTEEI